MDPKEIVALGTAAGIVIGVGVTTAVVAIRKKMSDPATEALEAAAKLVEAKDRRNSRTN